LTREADKPLAGKSALVTGASRGIGAAVATALSNAGARVVVLARGEAKLREVAARIGNDAIAIACDVADPSAVTRAAERFQREIGGPPDIIVNNAGLFQIKPIVQLSADEFSSTVQTNLVAPFLIIREFLRSMSERRSGDIVTIGSSADRNIFPGNGAYAASKFGARALHEVLRAETRMTGIRAILVSPSGVDTDLWEGISFIGSDEPPDRTMMIPPSAVADAVIYALSQPATVTVDELRLSRT
jgi:NADP-dependent 3-hydroxy acid dehydrogenase YdfG